MLGSVLLWERGSLDISVLAFSTSFFRGRSLFLSLCWDLGGQHDSRVGEWADFWMCVNFCRQMIPGVNVSRILARTGVDWILVDCEFSSFE